MTTEADLERIDKVNERFDRLTRHSGMPLKTGETHTLMTFIPAPGTRAAYDAALTYVAICLECNKPRPVRIEDVDEVSCPICPKCHGTGRLREHQFITFVAEVGRGKTHLALGIGWQWISNGYGTVKYWQVSELLDAMRAEYDNPPKDQYEQPLPGVFDRAKGCDLLILDDLGAEYHKQGGGQSWVDEKLDTLINYRWLEEKCTVFTTNLQPSQLQSRLRSRIKEGVVVTLEGIDYREFKAKQRREVKV